MANKILMEQHLESKGPVRLHRDNKAATSVAHNPVQHNRTKHIEVDKHFTKENWNM